MWRRCRKKAVPRSVSVSGQLHIREGHRQSAQFEPRTSARGPGRWGGADRQSQSRVRSRKLRSLGTPHVRGIGDRRAAGDQRRILHSFRRSDRLRRRWHPLASSARDLAESVHGSVDVQSGPARRKKLPRQLGARRFASRRRLQRHQCEESAAHRLRLRKRSAGCDVRRRARAAARAGAAVGRALEVLSGQAGRTALSDVPARGATMTGNTGGAHRAPTDDLLSSKGGGSSGCDPEAKESPAVAIRFSGPPPAAGEEGEGWRRRYRCAHWSRPGRDCWPRFRRPPLGRPR